MNNYLLELAIIHMSLMIAYWLFLKEESQYQKLRFYLIGSTLLAILIPFLKLPKLIGLWGQSGGSNEIINSVPLEAMEFSAATASQPFDWNILLYGYVAISLIFLSGFISKIAYLVDLVFQSSTLRTQDVSVKKSDKISGSFSFLNWVFIGNDLDESNDEYEAILQHELAHIKLKHSYDLIFLQLFKVFFWWLPSAWYINREIKKIHEYQADAYALKSYNIDRYSTILISATLKTNGLSLASSFHDGLILKRIKEMKKNAKKVSPWKLGALLSLFAILFTVFACSEEIDNEIKQMGEASNLISFDQLPVEMQNDLSNIKDNLVFTKVIIDDSDPSKESLALNEDFKNIDPSTIHSMNVVKNEDERAIYIALKKEGAHFDYIAEKSKMDGDVFTVVEEQPQYPGGMDAFYQYISTTMKYPEQARKAGVEGKVYVQFIVEKDGSISDIQTLKGIGAGCNAEAERVISNAGKFSPGSQRGKPVRVRMVLPVIFKLSEKSQTNNNAQGVIIIEELENNKDQLKIDVQEANGTYSGTIYDPNSGKPLPGVNIVEEGTNHGTVSDLDGSFKLKLSDKTNDLIISFVGYQSTRIPASK